MLTYYQNLQAFLRSSSIRQLLQVRKVLFEATHLWQQRPPLRKTRLLLYSRGNALMRLLMAPGQSLQALRHMSFRSLWSPSRLKIPPSWRPIIFQAALLPLVPQRS